MDTDELRSLRREFEKADIEFVKEDQRGAGARVGIILARSSDDAWIAIGPSEVDADTRSAIQEVLEAVARGQI